MPIGLGQMNYLYSLLQQKNPNSALLNPDFWSLRPKIDNQLRAKLIALMTNNKTQRAEEILKNL